MKRRTSPPRRSAPAVGGVCAHVGEPQVTNVYSFNDRLTRLLFQATCETMGLEAQREGPEELSALSVRAGQSAQDRLIARFETLMPQLDEKVTAVAADFIREHLGVEVRRPSRS